MLGWAIGAAALGGAAWFIRRRFMSGGSIVGGAAGAAAGAGSNLEYSAWAAVLPAHANWLIQPTLDACRDANVTPAIMFAVLRMESNFGLALTMPDGRTGVSGPETASGTNANGDDLGPFQINRRAHKAFVDTGAWRDIGAAALYATKLMASNLKSAAAFGLTGDALLQAGIAAYNTGWGNVRASLNSGKSPDATTTRGNYGATVMAFTSDFAARVR
jgi:hypothetical protein